MRTRIPRPSHAPQLFPCVRRQEEFEARVGCTSGHFDDFMFDETACRKRILRKASLEFAAAHAMGEDEPTRAGNLRTGQHRMIPSW